MRFTLIDQIWDIEAGKSVTALKRLTLAEEYLADHFPRFPVMPGVLMLQAIVEASAWLWRVTTDFRYSIMTLREAKNVKYGTFVEPGRTLELRVDAVKIDEASATFKGKGLVEGATAVTARVVLVGYNLRDRSPQTSAIDERLIHHWRERYAQLTGWGKS